MRVGIIGLGGGGGVLATELRDARRVASLLLMDKSAAAIRALASALGRKGLDTKQVDANRREAVAKAIRGCDVVVNAALSECNLTVMRAALDEGVAYLDVAATGPPRIRNGKAFPRFVPLYSREAFFSDVRIRPTVWQDGRLEDREPLSEEEAQAFPPSLGVPPPAPLPL